jgi:uncharacterized protein YeaC (DUF1315 family)
MKSKKRSKQMKLPRNIPFGQMTTTEIFQCLVEGKMPDGTIINQETRKASLARVVPIIKDWVIHDQKTLGNDWINTHPDDSFVIELKERIAMVAKGESIYA